MGEAKKSNFVEISPSGLPKVKGKKKIEKGGTGRKNGWGEKNGPHWPMKKNGIFFQIFFLLENFTLRIFLVHGV